MTMDILLLVAMVIAAVATVATARLMRAVIGLAATSAVLTVFMFRMDAPYGRTSTPRSSSTG